MQQPELIDQFPILEVNADYYLREPHTKDAERYFSYYSNPMVHRYILASVPRTVAEATQEINYSRSLFYNRRGVYWTIATKDHDYMVGAVGLYINNFHRRAEICYDLAYDYWRQGIMSNAIRVVRDYAVKELNMIRLEAITMAENDGSQAVLQLNGFNKEATLRHYKFFQGKAHDVELFAYIP